MSLVIWRINRIDTRMPLKGDPTRALNVFREPLSFFLLTTTTTAPQPLSSKSATPQSSYFLGKFSGISVFVCLKLIKYLEPNSDRPALAFGSPLNTTFISASQLRP